MVFSDCVKWLLFALFLTQACKNFINEQQCVAFCPLESIYDPRTYRKVPNVNAKYSYGTICVEKCPGIFLSWSHSGVFKDVLFVHSHCTSIKTGCLKSTIFMVCCVRTCQSHLCFMCQIVFIMLLDSLARSNTSLFITFSVQFSASSSMSIFQMLPATFSLL